MSDQVEKEYLLVTGGYGFIGAHFVEYIYNQFSDKYHIINMDCITYAADMDNIDSRIQNSPCYSFEKVDIRDKEAIRNIFNKYDIKLVVHFAAESHVCNSISNPLIFIETNVIGTFNLLDVARQHWMADFFKPKLGYEEARFVHISTDEVYGSLGQNGLFTENSQYLPNSPYSASKASSDLFVRSYHHTYGLKVMITHCSNNYGPKQHTEKLIPKTITSILNNQPITIHGNGNNVRDWLYVLDHCMAIYRVLTHGQPGSTYNIGADQEMSNLFIVHKICEAMDQILGKVLEKDSTKNLIIFVTDRPGNDIRYAIDSSKIQVELNWQKQQDFKKGILKTISYYLDKEKIKSLTEMPEYKLDQDHLIKNN